MSDIKDLFGGLLSRNIAPFVESLKVKNRRGTDSWRDRHVVVSVPSVGQEAYSRRRPKWLASEHRPANPHLLLM